MSPYGPPGVNAPHPSLPPRPPPSTASSATASYAPTVSAPPSAATPANYGPSAPPTTAAATSSAPSYYGATTASAAPSSAAQGQPRLGYSRTFAGVGGTGRGRGGYSNSSSSSYNNNNNSYSQHGGAPSYGPQSYGPQSYGPQSYGPQAPSGSASYGPSQSAANNYGAPKILNPFPAPNQQLQHQGYGSNSRSSYQNPQQQGAGGYEDAQMAAQIANWQSAYMPKDGYHDPNAAGVTGYYGQGGAAASGAAAGVMGPSYAGVAVSYGPDGTPISSGADSSADAANSSNNSHGGDNKKGDKHKTVYRAGGGKTWTDDSLLEWDPNHLRIFVGNLAGEVTDETLLKAFSRWKSVQKARVVREKFTKKSKGFGFVSFSDADDYFQAAREMEGKYIGSHPVKVRKSNTDIKVSSYNDKKGKKNGGGGGGGGGKGSNKDNKDNKKKNGGSGADYSKRDREPALGPVSTGVHKHGKTKGGLKLLG